MTATKEEVEKFWASVKNKAAKETMRLWRNACTETTARMTATETTARMGCE